MFYFEWVNKVFNAYFQLRIIQDAVPSYVAVSNLNIVQNIGKYQPQLTINELNKE